MCCAKFYFVGLWIALMCLTQLTGGAFLRCYKGTLDNYVVTPLDSPLTDLFTSCLDRSVPTVVYTFGYRGKVHGPATTAVLHAYIQKKKRNVILLDWEEEATNGLLGISLGYALSAVPNAKRIGRALGDSLIRLHAAGVNMTYMHLMGHSLGAHVMGYAGRRTREAGLSVERITGLDPAWTLFEGTFAVHNGLDRTCAKFVDIIHSDPGGYGTSNPTGTVDIWPNYGTKGAVQPGCPVGNFETFSPENYLCPDPQYGPIKSALTNLRMPFKRPNLCSHDRSWKYYVEAISFPTAFPAGEAENYDSWVANGGQTKQIIYLGDLTNTRARGNFFLTTNPQPLYGKGVDGLKPVKYQTRERRTHPFSKFLTYLR